MSAVPQFSRALNNKIQDKLWQWVQANYGLHGSWQTLWLNDLPLGRLNAQWQAQIQKDWQGESELRGGLHLRADNWLSLGDALQHMAYNWKQLGTLHGWRDERFDVCHENKILFPLERAAFRPLGLLSKAVHLNGFTFKNGEWQLWIGRRSKHKAVDPNKLDNLVSGGVSCGEDITATMLRESEEEAGLSAHHMQDLTLCNQLHSLRPVSRGLHNEVLYIFDTVLPADIIPKNQDGEVADFELLTVVQVVEAMLSDIMMSDAQLVILDVFDRYGLINSQHALSKWLKSIKTKG
ncbi:NUDIX hydrolase [Neisseria iguanae]|uniref:NUDIX hydrolase n=1 Tax=Neisseria iguanae TaxID=90242 RepID=A0A2P7U231_9NEIS|nr:NUDIX domain-containing protein [Neisseria iguanae]PSJ81026.1 NUDIX hydrolase [Neisseria iguanae]